LAAEKLDFIVFAHPPALVELGPPFLHLILFRQPADLILSRRLISSRGLFRFVSHRVGIFMALPFV